jgi:Putative zinc-finger
MNCRRIELLLSEHLEGLVSARDIRAMEDHLARCPACRRLHEELLAVRSGLRQLAQQLPRLETEIDHRAIDCWLVEREAANRGGRRWFYAASAMISSAPLFGPRRRQAVSRWQFALGGAAALSLAALTFSWWGHYQGAGRPGAMLAASPQPQQLIPPVRRASRPDEKHPGNEVALPPAAPIDKRGNIGRLPVPPPVEGIQYRRQEKQPPASGVRPHGVGGERMVVHRAPEAMVQPWRPFSTEEWEQVEARVRQVVRVRDDFVQIPFPQIAAISDRQIAEAVESYKREAAIVDPRLAHEVTLQFKATALSDLCDRLRAGTGIRLSAGPSVADEKVTLFCKQMPLREVMRQLSRPFGYTWTRSGKAGEYRYELVQDLRSQLLEEELRDRNRRAALLALDQEMQKLRPYLSLPPEEIVARAKTAPPVEKKLLEQLGGGEPRTALGWGPIQMYFRLSPQELAALRGGEELYFSEGPREGERPLPPDVARGILRAWRLERAIPRSNGWMGNGYALTGRDDPNGIPVSRVPGLRASCTVALDQTELGQYGLKGCSGFFGPSGYPRNSLAGPYVVGRRPDILQPENTRSDAPSTTDPALRARISLQPRPSCLPEPVSGGRADSPPEPRATSADVLEALHRATGLPLVADYYTRLYKPQAVSVRRRPIVEALNQLCDEMRMRWHWQAREGASGAGWLQFRSASYYDDKLKEVPNRLLTRWADVRRQRGFLPVDELVEIGQLTDAQLSSTEVADGAKECYGLAEWDLVRNESVLRNVRFLAGFTPEQRQEAMSPAGLPFIKMPRAQQQAYLARVFAREVWGTEGLQSMEDLNGAAVRFDYTQPGGYEWQPPGPYWLRWVVPYAKGPNGKRVFYPRVRERTREAALAALRRVDPEIRAALWQAAVRALPSLEAAPPAEEAQIVPTELNLATIYMPDAANKYHVLIYMLDSSNWPHTW